MKMIPIREIEVDDGTLVSICFYNYFEIGWRSKVDSNCMEYAFVWGPNEPFYVVRRPPGAMIRDRPVNLIKYFDRFRGIHPKIDELVECCEKGKISTIFA